MFSYNSFVSFANFFSKNLTETQEVNSTSSLTLFLTNVDFTEFKSDGIYFSYASERNGNINDTQIVSESQFWSHSSTGSTQVASSSSRSYYTDGDAGTSAGDPAEVTTTFEKAYDAIGTTSSRKYTLTSTTTTQFLQIFATVGDGTDTTILSGTASATIAGTITSQTYTTTSPETGTAYLFGSGLYNVLFDAGRGFLPPLRIVGNAIGILDSITNGPISAETFSGTYEKATELYSRKTAETITNNSTESPPNFTRSEAYTTSYEYFDITQISSTSLSPSFTANRKRLKSLGYVGTSLGSSIYTTYSATPSGLSDVLEFASIFNSVVQIKIYTESSTLADSDNVSSSLQWIYTNAGWSLKITRASNTSTSTTLFATISFSGSNETTTSAATHSVGNTTAFLGPILPVTLSSFNEISITLRYSGAASSNSTRPFYLYSARCGSSFDETSSFFSSIQTSITTIGSGSSPLDRITYADSELSAYKKAYGISFSTSSTTVYGFITAGYPSIWSHSKWNEAGVSDAISVNQ